jgi:predicted RNase H-like HicB family nuclease
METLTVLIGRNNDTYGVYSDDAPGIWGEGTTLEEAKKSFNDAIKLFKEYNSDENIPRSIRGDYQIIWRMEVESLIYFYKGIFTNAAYEKITGINQRQLSHYATGLKKPRPLQKKKIADALHKLGKELLAVEL